MSPRNVRKATFLESYKHELNKNNIKKHAKMSGRKLTQSQCQWNTKEFSGEFVGEIAFPREQNIQHQVFIPDNIQIEWGVFLHLRMHTNIQKYLKEK